MSPKRIVVQKISCIRSSGDAKETPGFQVSGLKDLGQDETTAKVGFIVSGVRLVAFQQTVGMGIRTRIKWIPTGFEIREEIHPLNGVVVDLQRRNNVIFVNGEDNSAVVMQGEPAIQNKAFTGQILQVNWKENEILIAPLHKQSSFHCVLNPRNNRIDCLVR
ncbi:MAG: hypothetical protein JSU57_04175 [Candidatus Heimdallarchaeota archaeon]|nr:MAG: hypothetical protein JSU57_04175 [Candidatus Heimdallarchaeota archaeon]